MISGTSPSQTWDFRLCPQILERNVMRKIHLKAVPFIFCKNVI